MPVDDRVAFEQQHVAWLDSHVVRPALMVIHFERIVLVEILCHTYDGRCHQRQTVDVGQHDVTFVVDSDSVHAARLQLRLCPFFQCGTCGGPDVFLQRHAGAAQSTVIDVNEGRRIIPSVGIHVAMTPVLFLLRVLVGLPKVGDELREMIWCPDLVKPDFGQIDHGLWLPSIHEQSIHLELIASETVAGVVVEVMLTTSIKMVDVHVVPVAQRLDGLVLVLCRSRDAGIDVVWQVVVVGGHWLVDGEGDIDAVGRQRRSLRRRFSVVAVDVAIAIAIFS
mmetsp:Transcript_2538/g.7052  ORF Transcript_2538/g.7052 Transcript_2538/m.7052 type:complete len:279 (+) Transcript_2538:755-1591(+)